MTRRLVTDASLRRRRRIRMRSIQRLAARQHRDVPGAALTSMLRRIRANANRTLPS